MRWLKAPPVLDFSLALLLAIVGPLGKMASAQEAEPSDFDVNAPVASLRTADLSTDQQRVRLAMKLLKARADTKISHDAYRKGVLYFQNHHPGFYGNFFGDPLYATYDVDYQRLVWERRLAAPDINPLNSFWSSTWFFCNPLSYNPAFSGRCRGFRFTVSDFFQVPPSLRPHTSSFPETSILTASADRFSGTRFTDRARHGHPGSEPSERTPRRTPDTLRTPCDTPDEDRDTPSIAFREKAPSPDRSSHRIQLPDDVYDRVRQKATSMKRTEMRLHLERHIRKEYGGREDLSPRERAKTNGTPLSNRILFWTVKRNILPAFRVVRARAHTGADQLRAAPRAGVCPAH